MELNHIDLQHRHRFVGLVELAQTLGEFPPRACGLRLLLPEEDAVELDLVEVALRGCVHMPTHLPVVALTGLLNREGYFRAQLRQ